MAAGDYISKQEAADITGLKPETIRHALEKGEVEGAYICGRTWLVPREWAETHRVEAVPADALTVKEAAELLGGFSRQAVLQAVNRGQLKAYRRMLRHRSQVFIDARSAMAYLARISEKKGEK